MVLIIAYMCMFHPYEDQLAVNYSVSILDKMGKIIGTHSENNDKECESDGFNLKEYLERRRKCLLKHCGDVCTTTKTDSGKIMILQSENFQSINYYIFFRNRNILCEVGQGFSS